MNTINKFRIALVLLFGLLPILLFGQPNNPNDPNTDPNWDWRIGDDTSLIYPGSVYRMYVKNANQQIVPTMIPGPWGQPNVWEGLFDNKREHGWVLICRDFGAPNRAIFGDLQTNRCPYFVLYNRYRGILRVIFIVRGAQQNFTKGALIAQWEGDYNKRSATLTHLKPRAYATDKPDSSRNNSASALIHTVVNDKWAWADFPMAYDPTIVPSSSELLPRILFKLIGTTESQVVLKGAGTGINGQPEEVRQFMTASNNGSVALTGALPSQINQVGTSVNLGDLFTKVVGSAEKWEKFVEVAEKLGKKIKSNPSNPLHNIIYPTVQFLATGALSTTGIGSIAGAVAGLFDFFTAGGQPDPSPTYFGFNLEVAGTIKTEYIVNQPVSIVIPASKTNVLTQPNVGSSVPLVYDKPVGLFNLTSTPVVKYKSYFQDYPGTIQSRRYNDFQIQNFQYAVNPESGLQLDSVRVWIVADVTANVSGIPPEQSLDLALLAQWVQGQNLTVSGGHRPIQLESMIDGKYVFGSIPVSENAIVGQTIQMPQGNRTADITIKVKAVFHRKDNPSEKPIVFIATYEPDLVADGTGRYPLPPPPPPAPAFRTVNVTRQYLEIGSFNSQTISQYAPSTTVTVPASENIGGHNYVFQQWSDGNTDLSRTITIPGVTSLSAEYKGFRLSTIPDLAGKSGGSRTAAIDAVNSNVWYQVYESNNAIWLSHSTNAGASWQPELKLGDGKNPSIANGGVVWVNGGLYFRTVGFQDGSLNLGSVWSSILHNPGQPSSLFIDPIPDAHPCIAYKRESDGAWSYYIVYEHRLRTSFTNYPNTELRLIRLGSLGNGFGVKSVHTVPNSLYAQSYVSLYPSIAVDNASNPNVNTPATIAWQNYVPSVSDGIKVCEANLVNSALVFGAQHTFAAGSSSTVQYQKPTIVLDASNHPHLAWQALDQSHPYGARTVVLYKALPSYNDPSSPITKFLYYDSMTNPSIGFANGTVSLVWDYSAGTCYGATRSASGSWGAWQSFLGEEPRLMQTGAKQIAYAKANSGLFDVKLTSRTGLTYHDLGANLLPDTLALSPSTVFSLLKSRRFTLADTVNQVSATVKVHSEHLYDLTQHHPVQLAVELVQAQTGSSIALSQTALVTASDTAKDLHFTMTLPTAQSGTEAELRVKVLGFASQASHKASALNEIELVSATGGTAIANRAGNQGRQSQSVGSVPTKFALHQNYPNPFNPVTLIRYELPQASVVKLQVFDVLGRVVATVVNERREAGIYEAVFNAGGLSSGTYFYRLESRSSSSQAGTFVETKKMMLVK